MKPHECKESDICTCYAFASEPSDDCPIHGCGDWPRARCGICGRFMKTPLFIQDKGLEHALSKAEYEEYR